MDQEDLLNDQPLGHKLIKKGSRAYLFMFATAPIGYLIKLIVSNTLSVEDIGIFYSVLGFVFLISLYNDLGFTEALQYFLPKYRIEKQYNKYKTIMFFTLGIQLITGILIGGALYLGADRLAIHHFKSISAVPVIQTLAFYFLGVNFLQVFSAVFYAFQDTKRNGIVETVKMYGTLLFTLIFWLTHTMTLANFSIARITGIFLAVATCIRLFRRHYRHTLHKGTFHFDPHTIKTQISYAFWIFLGANAGTLLGQVDQQLIINFLGARDAGYYSNFYTLLGGYNVIISPLLLLILPIVSELQTKKDTNRMTVLQTIFYKYFSVFALSMGTLFVVIGPEITTALFGQKFLTSGQLLQYIGPTLILQVLFTINFSILGGMGKAKERVKILFWALLANIIINILAIMVFKIGLLGAVIGIAGGWLVLFRMTYRLVYKAYPFTFNRKYFLSNTGLFILLGAIIRYGKSFFLTVGDQYRYSNFARIIAIIIGYYLIIAGANWKSIQVLRGEIKGVRG